MNDFEAAADKEGVATAKAATHLLAQLLGGVRG